MPIEKTSDAINESLEKATQQVMNSISTHGLRSLKDIPLEAVIPTSVLQIQNLTGHICVNYINLCNANAALRTHTLNLAVDEEYCGIYGISIERRWPFEKAKDPERVQAEIIERLMSCIVFILNPPTRGGYSLPRSTPEVAAGTWIAHYTESKEDSFSGDKARGRLLTEETNNYAASCNRIVEIKTKHAFAMSEVLAIMAPQHLYSLVTRSFPRHRVIEVLRVEKKLYRIPEILQYLHGEEIEGVAQACAPDFKTALSHWQLTSGVQQFSLHAVRLPTHFDWAIRPIASMNQASELIKTTQAKPIVSYEDGSGIVLVHKAYGSNVQTVLDTIAQGQMPRDLLESMRQGSKEFIRIFAAFASSKGDGIFNRAYDLKPNQLRMLSQSGVKIIHHELAKCHYLYFHKAIKNHVGKIVDNFSLLEYEARQTIYAVTKGFFARKKMWMEAVANRSHKTQPN